MGFFSAIIEKVSTKFQGELITDLGTLSIDEDGESISVSIRRHPGKKPHLQVKRFEPGKAAYFQIPCSCEWADQFEKIALEMRKQLDAPVA